MIPESLCDCGDEPRRGIAVGKHMTTCRYGIIEEWESYRAALAAPVPPSIDTMFGLSVEGIRTAIAVADMYHPTWRRDRLGGAKW